MMIAFTLLLLAGSLCISACYVLALLPFLWVLQGVVFGQEVSVITAGAIHLTGADVIFLSAVARSLWAIWMNGGAVVADRSLYTALCMFLAVNALASVIAGLKFGHSHMSHSLVSLARLTSEMMSIPVMAQLVSTHAKARRCVWVVVGFVSILAIIQFINYVGVGYGITIGEVQGIERGEMRYFGPVGDSVGFVLLFGFLAALCSARIVFALGFAFSILLTAGVGSIFALCVAVVVFLCFAGRIRRVTEFMTAHVRWLPLTGLLVVICFVVASKPLLQTLAGRLISGSYGNSGAQRMASGSLALSMAVDNPLFGVGYMGYESVLPYYGGEAYFDLSKPDGATANPNNQVLQCLADAGLSGLLACGLFLGCAVRTLFRAASVQTSVFLSGFCWASMLWLLALIIGDQAASWVIPSSHVARLLWVCLGIGVAVNRLSWEDQRAVPAGRDRCVASGVSIA